MANTNRRNHWESSLLASALALAGTLFFFDKLGILTHRGILSLGSIMHTSPALLIVVGLSLLLADGTEKNTDTRKESATELRHE